MKRKLLPILLSAIMAMGALGIAACTNSYTIAFVSNNGSAVESIVAKEGADITAPTDPTKTGYVFDGWFKDADLSFSYTIPSTMPGESFNLYARWKKAAITVNFNSNGGSSVAPSTGEAQSDINVPTDPTKEGHHFAGWFSDTNLTAAFDFIMPIYDATVYAKWVRLEDKTSLDFNADWTPGDANAYMIAVDGKNTTITSTESKSEYSYVGILISQNVKAYNTFVLNITGTNKEEILIKCQNGGVVAAESKFLMTGKANQKIIWTVTSENLTDGQAPMNFYIFVRPGQKAGNAAITIHSFDLYRSRSDSDSFQSALFFNTVGGTGIDSIFTDANATITKPTTDPEKAGYTFAGWYTTADYTTPFVFDKMPEGKTTVHARWQANGEVTLTFNTNGGNAIESIKKPAGAALTAADKPANPTKADVMFDAWYLNETFTKTFDFKTMPDDSATLYARWVIFDTNTPIILSNNLTTKEKYIITENSNGTTTVSIDTGKGSYSMFGTKLELNAKDYSFIEIVFTGSVGKGILFKCQNGGITAVETKLTMTGEEQTLLWKVDPSKNLPDGSSPMDLYMCLDPGKAYTDAAPSPAISVTIKSMKVLRSVEPGKAEQRVIHFVANGGYSVSPLFKEANAPISLPTPRKRGFKFEGWFTTNELTTAFVATSMPAANTIVFAKWAADTVAVAEYALKKDGWSVVDGFTSYTVATEGNFAKINFEHAGKWNAKAAAAYAVSDMGVDGSRYSKIKLNAKLLSTSIAEQTTTLRIRFYSLDQGYSYNGSTTATFEVKILADELNTDKEFILDLNTITNSGQKAFLDNLLTNGSFAIAMNIYTGTNAADHGTGSLLITSFVFA